MKTNAPIVIAIVSCGMLLYGQEPMKGLSGAGPDRIYVNCGLDLASKAHPVNGCVGYRIERKSVSEKKWKTVADIEATASIGKFRDRLEAAMKVVPEPVPVQEIPIDKLWERVEKYRRLDSLRFWSSLLPVRIALGMTYVDADAARGVTYEYRVSKVNNEGTAHSSALSQLITWPGIAAFSAPKIATQTPKGNRIILKWKLVGGKRPSGFKVFRQEQLQGDFVPLAPDRTITVVKDSIFCALRDSLVQPVYVYRYFIVPMDYYGNTGLTSDTVLVASYDFRAIPLPEKITAESLDSIGGIRISWRLADSVKARQVQSVKIFRSDKWDGSFAQIAEVAATATSYRDQQARPMVKYFYYLVMAGAMGEASQPSAKVAGIYQSAVQPVRPWIISCKADRSGVKLELGCGESGIAGYRVYRGIAGQALSPLSGLVPKRDSLTVFIDNDSTVSGKLSYAYAVRAESESHRMSDLSDTSYVRPGKSTKPGAAKNISALTEGSVVQLYWMDMRPLENALDGYIVYRREATGKKPAEPAVFAKLTARPLPAGRNRYTDTTAAAGTACEYAVQCVDIFGGTSDTSLPVRVEPSVVAPIPPQGLRTSGTSLGILVQWDTTFQKDIAGYGVYRYERGKKPELVATVPVKEQEFVDKKVQKGVLYFYFVTCRNSKTVESAPSREAGIRW